MLNKHISRFLIIFGTHLVMKVFVLTAIVCLFCTGFTQSSDVNDNLLKSSSLLGDRSDVDCNSVGPEIVSMSIEAKILFRYSRTTIKSNVVNKNQFHSCEYNFQLILPEEAFISNFAMKTNGTRYNATVMSKEDARNNYTKIKEGKPWISAAIIELAERRSSSFNISFSIGANQKMAFGLVYEELLKRKEGQYEHLIFLLQEQYLRIKDLSISISIEESQNITFVNIPPNDLTKGDLIIKRLGNKAYIRWNVSESENRSRVSMDNLTPFKVIYEIAQELEAGEALVRNGYFVHFYAPKHLLPLRKHVVFVLDTSGSMYGNKLKQVKMAMLEILDDLKMDDFFNIVTFSNTATMWSYFNGRQKDDIVPFPAVEEYKYSARYFLNNTIAKDYTNIYASLKLSLKICQEVVIPKETVRNQIPRSLPSNVESIIIFLTDGDPTFGSKNLTTILEKIKAKNADLRVPIYSLSFGSQANFQFLQQLSLQNYAFSRKIYEEHSVANQLKDFYFEISSPVLTNVSFKYTVLSAEYNLNELTETDISVVNKGSEIAIAGKFSERSRMKRSPVIKAKIDAYGRYGLISFEVMPMVSCSMNTNAEGGISRFSEKSSCMRHRKNEDEFLERLIAYIAIKQLIKKDLSGEFKQAEGTMPTIRPLNTSSVMNSFENVLSEGLIAVNNSFKQAISCRNDSILSETLKVRVVVEESTETIGVTSSNPYSNSLETPKFQNDTQEIDSPAFENITQNGLKLDSFTDSQNSDNFERSTDSNNHVDPETFNCTTINSLVYEQTPREKAIELALKYNFVTPYTSLFIDTTDIRWIESLEESTSDSDSTEPKVLSRKIRDLSEVERSFEFDLPANLSTPIVFVQEMAMRHNELRLLHDVPALRIDSQLCIEAEALATTIGETSNTVGKLSLKHERVWDRGENIWVRTDANNLSGTVPVDAWYSQISRYRFDKAYWQGTAREFTQIVWRNSKIFGVGKYSSLSGGFTIVVALYAPRGNIGGRAFIDNVFPPKEPF